MTRWLIAAVLAVVALLLGGCGASDEDKASTAIAASITKAQKTGGAAQLDVTTDEADCIGNGWVDKIGTDRLKKYGVLTEDLKTRKTLTEVDDMSADDATSATAVLFDCTDIPSMMKKVVAASGQVPKGTRACINKALTEQNLRPYLEATFQGKTDQAQELLTKRVSACALGSG